MKRVKLVILLVGVFLLTGCNGDITRDIRHEGFSIGSDFVCSNLVPDKDGNYEKIKFLGTSYAVTDKGKVYDLSLGQVYANKANCKKADTDIKINAIFDANIGRGEDGKLYYLTSSNNIAAYNEVSANDNSSSVANLIMADKTIIKVATYDANAGSYYVLKDDGNVYNYIVTRADYNSAYAITSISLIYNSEDYGGKIIDFNDVGNSPATFIRTKDSIYKMTVTNSDKCTKYADVSCKYKSQKSEMLTEHSDVILAYNGAMLITSYGKTFNASN